MLLLLALLAGSLLALPAPAAPSDHARAAPMAVADVVHPALVHGDLVVTAANSPFVISPSTVGTGVYYEAGNVTIATGGTLIIQNETFSFVQFVGDTGTVANRLSHIYSFSDQGSLQVSGSTVTTNASVLNAYTKLLLNISGGGQATFDHSALAFPGWVSVYGTGSHLQLNSSNLSSNPAISGVTENTTLWHDNLYGPALTVSGGAAATLGQSSVLDYYKDNTSAHGLDLPTATWTGQVDVSSASGATFSTWGLPSDAENLSRMAQYRTISGGYVDITYNTTGSSTASSSTLTLGTAFGLGSVSFHPGFNVVAVPLSAAAVAGINSQGVLAFLTSTGAFGGTSSLTFAIGTTGSATVVNITSVAVQLTPALQYDVVVTGAGSTLTAVDSLLDLNWSVVAPSQPWVSNKLMVENGAEAFLAGVSITHPLTAVYQNQSVALPDASSHVYLYRWLDVPVVGASGLPISSAQAVAFSSALSSSASNTTATSMNALGTMDPDLAAYVAAWDAQQHLNGYGVSNATGIAHLLLATTELDQSNLPTGDFVGSYHVGVTVPGAGAEGTQWSAASTTPYPLAMSPSAPDLATAVSYPNYSPSVAVGTITVSLNGTSVANTTHLLIGQKVGFQVQLVNSGLLPVASYSLTMGFIPPASSIPLVIGNQVQGTNLPAGGIAYANFTWVVNETITGLHGFGEQATIDFYGPWSGSVGSVGGTGGAPGGVTGNISGSIGVTVDPAPIHLYFSAPGGQYVLSNEYAANGSVSYTGYSTATIDVTAVSSSGQTYLLAIARVYSGPFSTTIVPDPSMTSGTYSLNVSATYNGRTAYYNLPDQFTVGTVSTTTTPWYEQTILGIQLLYLILIAIVVVAAVLAVLLVSRRAARGKLVECGECGGLIPENATICPKCGAEFEANLVRCSRCGSTIPANSKVCPECAAQLLGSMDEATKDPERQGYADFVERYRAEAKKELGDNYNEGAFWDWWKRQGSYLSFSQWRLQQVQGTRAGMTAPVASTDYRESESDQGGQQPPRRGGGGASPSPGRSAAPPPQATARPPPPRQGAAPPRAGPAGGAGPGTGTAAPEESPEAPAAGSATKACSNCGREIPTEYLVCPFCSAVTR